MVRGMVSSLWEEAGAYLRHSDSSLRRGDSSVVAPGRPTTSVTVAGNMEYKDTKKDSCGRISYDRGCMGFHLT